MPRNKKGRCVNCCEQSSSLTKDHLLPKAWYSTTTPANFNKPTFPSCETCNGIHGQSEERILRSIGITITPGSEKAPGIPEKVIRSMNMSATEDPEKAEIRGRIKSKFLNSTVYVPPREIESKLNLLPGLDFDPEVAATGAFASQIEGSDIKRLACKIARGVTYLEYGLFIENSQEIIPTPYDQPYFTFANKIRELPGLQIRYGTYLNEESPALLFVLRLWNQLTLRVVAFHRDDDDWRETVMGRRTAVKRW